MGLRTRRSLLTAPERSTAIGMITGMIGTTEGNRKKGEFCANIKGVDKGGGGLGELKPPQIFWQTLYYGGVVMQKWVW